ncbi:alpha/beta hydrolase [Halomonas halocynthiae]|uniref:alpha/beta hydrolase n=1 Tax=Halomonas halocynthiae TaxID=176290 RepID=UPI00041C7FAB|nr:alpha/beta hydrolase [Halomonas halocynthiae]
MSQQALDKEYSPSLYAPGFEDILAKQASQGHAFAAAHAPQHLQYGKDPAACLDLFVPEGKGPWPLMVFIHGGYWQELSHTATNFLAKHYLERGMAFASLGYELAPQVSIETMIEQCHQGLRAAITQLKSQGGHRSLVLGGHSAGAQLAFWVATAEAAAKDSTPIDELLLVSGVFDLTPLTETYVNAPLGLDAARAHLLSPRFGKLSGLPPVHLIIAEHDTPAFRRQCHEFFAAILNVGGTANIMDLPGCNHFDVLDHLATCSSGESKQ